MAVEQAGGQEGLSTLVRSLGTLAGWNPYIVYGGVLWGAFKGLSEVVEAIYNKACFETELNEFGQGI